MVNAEKPDVLFKGLCTDSLPHRHSYWALTEGQYLRKCQRHTERDCMTKLFGFRQMTKGTVSTFPV